MKKKAVISQEKEPFDIIKILTNSDKKKELKLILKADSNGSLEALNNTLAKLNTDDIKIKIVAKFVGTLNESDVLLAKTSDAILVAYNINISNNIQKLVKQESVNVINEPIIYTITDKIQTYINGILKPETEEIILGKARVIRLFNHPKSGVIAGCIVEEGEIKRDVQIRVIQNDEEKYSGKIIGLRQERDDKREIKTHQECGILLEDYNDFKIGDKLECFTIIDTKN